MVSFDSYTPREQMRLMLINWHAAREIGISLVSFGGGRGFNVKCAR